VRETRGVAGGSILLIFFVVGIASIVLIIMTAVSASKYPDWAFQQVGTSKFIWQILPIIFLFVCGWVGLIMGIVWFASKRDEVERAAQSAGGAPYGYGPPPQQYGGPPPGWGPPPAPGTWSPPQAPQGFPPPPAQPQGSPPPQPPEEPPQ
jgi:hypothetical protein